MSVANFIGSGFVACMIEVPNGPGMPLVANTKSFISFSSPTPAELAAAQNQLWTFSDGPRIGPPGAFYISSQTGSHQVIEVIDSEDAPGAQLRINTQKPVGNEIELDEAINQLWQWVPTVVGSSFQGPILQRIRSLLNKDLVIDIKGGKDIPQSLLQLYPIKPTRTDEEYAEASKSIMVSVSNCRCGAKSALK